MWWWGGWGYNKKSIKFFPLVIGPLVSGSDSDNKDFIKWWLKFADVSIYLKLLIIKYAACQEFGERRSMAKTFTEVNKWGTRSRLLYLFKCWGKLTFRRPLGKQ